MGFLFALYSFLCQAEGTDWFEPVLLWISIRNANGYGEVFSLQILCDDGDPSWLSDDQSFKKMGDMMFHNHWKLLQTALSN